MTWINEPEFEGSDGREIVSGHTLIATVYNTTDAHLIAAAPDLLAALEAYELFTGSLANTGEMTPDAWIELDKLHHKACLALNRAKGN